MNLKILVLNCGSSSLKYKLFGNTRGEALAWGQADRIGQADGRFQHEVAGRSASQGERPLRDHREAIETLLRQLLDEGQGVLKDVREFSGIGHRVVHGGEHFKASMIIDEKIRTILEDTKKLAPLHNPSNLAGIDVCSDLLPGVPQVAVFDTAFHQTMPEQAYIYAIPYRYYQEDHVRRYGFHGTSHRYVAARAAELIGGSLGGLKIVTCHLGNGSSLCAVAGGRSLDTTMGFTPLSGLVMGTRCGDMDPAVVAFLAEKEGLSIGSVMEVLNRQSGVLGVSGLSQDFRDLEEASAKGHRRARLALKIFAYSAAKGIASMIPAMGGLDALVFTAGIGEHSPEIRRNICSLLAWLGVTLDEDKNRGLDLEGEISGSDTGVRVLVIPTDEERIIALETAAVLKKGGF